MSKNFSSGMTSTIKNAMRIACGGKVVERLDNSVEINSGGRQVLISKQEYLFSKDILLEAEKTFLELYGHVRPYTTEVILALEEVLETIVENRMSDIKLRVALIKADSTGCGYWRCEEPARVISKLYSDKVYIEATNVVHFESLLTFDVISIQRGMFGDDTASIMAIIERLKSARKKIVYEVDDDLSTLLPDNNCYYAKTPIDTAAVAWLIKECDAITCSTEKLKEKLGHPEKTFVLPNSLDIERLFIPPRIEGRDDYIFILWHGGDSHEKDIRWLEEYMSKLIEKKKKLEMRCKKEIIFGFMGYFPTYLDQYLRTKFMVKTPETVKQLATLIEKRDNKMGIDLKEVVIEGRTGIRYLKGIETKQFHQYLCNLNPDIAICPLVPNLEFNSSKSSIKAYESMIAGAATVVTNTLPYSEIPDDVVMKGATPFAFMDAVEKLILDDNLRKGYQERGKKWVEDNFDLNKNARLWVEAYAKLAGVDKTLIFGKAEGEEGVEYGQSKGIGSKVD